MFGFLDATTGPLRTEFGAYTESVCTIAGFKAVEYMSDDEMMEDLDTWDCHICRAIGVKDRRRVRERNDPDRFKNVTLWADNAESITAAVALAMQDMKSETIARAFECKTANMREIVKAEGGNNFKPAIRREFRCHHRVYCVPFGLFACQSRHQTSTARSRLNIFLWHSPEWHRIAQCPGA
jgi:hypothetical protein